MKYLSRCVRSKKEQIIWENMDIINKKIMIIIMIIIIIKIKILKLVHHLYIFFF